MGGPTNKDMRTKIKDFLKDSQTHRALIEEQKKYVTTKN